MLVSCDHVGNNICYWTIGRKRLPLVVWRVGWRVGAQGGKGVTSRPQLIPECSLRKSELDWCSTFDSARHALLGVTVFPVTLKTLSSLQLRACCWNCKQISVPLLALKISLRNFFTTLLEGTRLLSSLPYSKVKNHYSQGPDYMAQNTVCNIFFIFVCKPGRLENSTKGLWGFLKKKFLTPSLYPQIKDKGGWDCTNIRLDSDVSHSTEIIVYYCWGEIQK